MDATALGRNVKWRLTAGKLVCSPGFSRHSGRVVSIFRIAGPHAGRLDLQGALRQHAAHDYLRNV